jgi:hypothetical protein
LAAIVSSFRAAGGEVFAGWLVFAVVLTVVFVVFELATGPVGFGSQPTKKATAKKTNRIKNNCDLNFILSFLMQVRPKTGHRICAKKRMSNGCAKAGAINFAGAGTD